MPLPLSVPAPAPVPVSVPVHVSVLASVVLPSDQNCDQGYACVKKVKGASKQLNSTLKAGYITAFLIRRLVISPLYLFVYRRVRVCTLLVITIEFHFIYYLGFRVR